jgi:hypothetical protein
MSDFLSNLIARSFTDAPVIQPRVPSLFETATDEFFNESQWSTRPIEVPETIGHTVAPKPSPTRDTVTPKSIANPADTRAEQHLRKPDAPAHEPARVIAQLPQASMQAAEVRKIEVETKRISPPVNSFGDEEKGAGEKKRGPEEFSERRSVPPRHRKDFSPVDQRSSTSPPIIRVTIGRVEVCAVHPPAPTPKQPKRPPPKLSLEDYLHKRDGGSQ